MGVEIIPATAARMAEIQAWLEVEQAAYDTAAAALETRWDPDVELPERGFYAIGTWSSGRSRGTRTTSTF
jgi:hypothetical protein